MACNAPLSGFKREDGTVRVLTRKTAVSPFRDASEHFDVPCGRCFGCRQQKATEWAVRCKHELMFHDKSAFLTLTYDPEHVPPYGSLDKDAPGQFIKSLRNDLRGYGDPKVRYFGCGEYGETNHRPHYHMILFGWDFPDKKQWSIGENPLFVSEQLTELWPYGFSSIGTVTLESAAYVARYAVKKLNHLELNMTDSNGLKPYEVITESGEVKKRLPEFGYMSKHPGIGAKWLDKYYKDAFPSDTLHLDGKRVPIPRYYRKRLEECDPDLSRRVNDARIAYAKKSLADKLKRKELDEVLEQSEKDNDRVELSKKLISDTRKRDRA